MDVFCRDAAVVFLLFFGAVFIHFACFVFALFVGVELPLYPVTALTPRDPPWGVYTLYVLVRYYGRVVVCYYNTKKKTTDQALWAAFHRSCLLRALFIFA